VSASGDVGAARRERDAGAALILAIAFVVTIGAVLAGLTALVTSGVGDRRSIERLRDRDYAAEGAIELAIAELRNTPPAAHTCAAAEPSSTTSINGITIRVERDVRCSVARGDDGIPVALRRLVLSSCVDHGVACTSTETVVRAEVDLVSGADATTTEPIVRSWVVGG
jgi:hypothetical protein